MDMHIDYSELQYICTTVFPSHESLKYLQNRDLIHYEPTEPDYGDRLVQSDVIDYYGNEPYRYFTLRQEQQARELQAYDNQGLEQSIHHITLHRNYQLTNETAIVDQLKTREQPSQLMSAATEALNALDDAISAGDQAQHDQFKDAVDVDTTALDVDTTAPDIVVDDQPSQLLDELTQQHRVSNLYSEKLEDKFESDDEVPRQRAMSRDPVQSAQQLFGTSTVIESIDGEVVAQIDLPTAMPAQFYSSNYHYAANFQPHITIDGEAVTTPQDDTTTPPCAAHRDVLDVIRRETPPNTPDHGSPAELQSFNVEAVSSKLSGVHLTTIVIDEHSSERLTSSDGMSIERIVHRIN